MLGLKILPHQFWHYIRWIMILCDCDVSQSHSSNHPFCNGTSMSTHSRHNLSFPSSLLSRKKITTQKPNFTSLDQKIPLETFTVPTLTDRSIPSAELAAPEPYTRALCEARRYRAYYQALSLSAGHTRISACQSLPRVHRVMLNVEQQQQ